MDQKQQVSSAGPFPARVDRNAGADNGPDHGADDGAEAVAELYRVHALGLGKLAYVVVGDRETADDIVQDAFSGLFRRWSQLSDPDKALPYLRSAVLNSSRSVLRSRRRVLSGGSAVLAGERGSAGRSSVEQGSAESAVLGEEERRAVISALRRLPRRQREVLVLRFYLDQPEALIAAQLEISQSTVRSSSHRGLRALARILKETS